MNPDPLLFSPDDAAWQMEVIGLDHQRSGMPTGEVTSSAAPVSERLRTVQSKAAPPNEILPAFKNRRRGAVLCSSTTWTSA
jgi:hypothetical protein